eukprot:scaffold133127_cov48-Phaeocystis_antarctica.AAC.3
MTARPPGWGWALAATTAAPPAPHPAAHPGRRQRKPRSVPTARSIAWRGSLYPGRASSLSAAPRWQASHAAGYHPAARAAAAATGPRPPTAPGPSPVGAEPPGRGGACAPETRWRCCCCRRLPPCVAGGGGVARGSTFLHTCLSAYSLTHSLTDWLACGGGGAGGGAFHGTAYRAQRVEDAAEGRPLLRVRLPAHLRCVVRSE